MFVLIIVENGGFSV